MTIERVLSDATHGSLRLLQGRRVDLVAPTFLTVRIREQVMREAEPLDVAA